MCPHKWVFEVLLDLQQYCKVNKLQHLETSLDSIISDKALMLSLLDGSDGVSQPETEKCLQRLL